MTKSLNEGRGVNPGDTRDTPRGARRAPALNEGRGVNPGDTRTTHPGRRSARPLNEGRGVNPGDTGARHALAGRLGPRRSTKAGA